MATPGLVLSHDAFRAARSGSRPLHGAAVGLSWLDRQLVLRPRPGKPRNAACEVRPPPGEGIVLQPDVERTALKPPPSAARWPARNAVAKKYLLSEERGGKGMPRQPSASPWVLVSAVLALAFT